MSGTIALLSYIGLAITAIVALKGVARLVVDSMNSQVQLPKNSLTLQTLWQLAKHLYRHETIILGFFLLTSVGLIAEYFTGWSGPPRNFLEVMNILCIVNFWVHFRTTNLSQ